VLAGGKRLIKGKRTKGSEEKSPAGKGREINHPWEAGKTNLIAKERERK